MVKTITSSTSETTFTVRRLMIPVPDVREFQRAYARAVPDAPFDEVAELVRQRAPWTEMLKLIDARAPHGFLIYFRKDVHPVMQAAGDPADCIALPDGKRVPHCPSYLRIARRDPEPLEVTRHEERGSRQRRRARTLLLSGNAVQAHVDRGLVVR